MIYFQKRVLNAIRRKWQQSFLGLTVASLLNTSSASVRVILVAATRLSEQEFEKKTLLGQRIARLKYTNTRISAKISYSNRVGLPEIYNAAIKDVEPKDILVFLHDDVWFGDLNLSEKLDAALGKFDIVGVAGNVRRVSRQPAWLFNELTKEGQFIWDHGKLSGAIRHGEKDESPLSVYGPSPIECELLDGVFLAVRGKTLLRNKIKFDEQFKFHFYDMDFCRSARKCGLLVGTWPLELVHLSSGAFGGTEWQKAYEKYLRKWKS